MADFLTHVDLGTADFGETYEFERTLIAVHLASTLDADQIMALLDHFGMVLLEDLMVEGQSDVAQAVSSASRRLQARDIIWAAANPSSTFTIETVQSLVADQRIRMASPVYHVVDGDITTCITPLLDRFVIHIADDADDGTLGSIQSNGLTILRGPSEITGPSYLLGFDGGPADPERAFALREQFKAMDGIVSCDFRWMALAPLDSGIPNDTWWAHQWNLKRIDAQKAWSITMGDPAVTIAVIDDGFDLTHQDLTFTDPSTHFSTPDFDSGKYLSGVPMDAQAGPLDTHGTNISGIAAARTNNGAGVAGVAGDCNVMPVKIVAFDDYEISVAIRWAANRGAQIINLSLHCSPSFDLYMAIQYASGAGCILCAAAGNNGAPAVNWPARYPEVIAVGAAGKNGLRKTTGRHSNYGFGLDVLAPGVDCWTTDLQGAVGSNWHSGGSGNYTPSLGDAAGNYFALQSNTSAATPHVSGLAALVRSEFPALSPQEVRVAIVCGCEMVAYPNVEFHDRPDQDWYLECGYGLINCAKTMDCAAAITASEEPPAPETTPPGATICLTGYLGESTRDGHLRLYCDPTFRTFLEFRRESLVSATQAGSATWGLQRYVLQVRPDAVLVETRIG